MPSVECNFWKQFPNTGSVERNPPKGRPRATMGREDRHLSILAKRNSEATDFKLNRKTCCLSPALVYEQEIPFNLVLQA
ncbi:hypothetical protein TNCV_2836411 [Trichonephila clavipes]|nr:hypothetical protein TNCV_2836411 [Trichonephila clavipes]